MVEPETVLIKLGYIITNYILGSFVLVISSTISSNLGITFVIRLLIS
jgi:hypothetical protein